MKRSVRYAVLLALALTPLQPGAAAVVARQQIAGPNGLATVALDIDGELRAKLVLRDAQGRRVDERFLDTTADVLPILANRRMAVFWPALTAWGGPGLEHLRARMLAQSDIAWAEGKTAFRSTIKGYARSRTNAALERAGTLTLVGRADAGLVLMRSYVAGLPVKSDDDKTDFSIAASRLAGMLVDSGQLDQALEVFESAAARIPNSGGVMNLLLNRAIALALAGRYEEALAAFRPAQERYQNRPLIDLLKTIPGSRRHFAWIEACALNGLGRAEEARRVMSPALGEDNPASLVRIASNSEVRLGAYLCMQDREAYVAEALANLRDEQFAPAAALLLQPSGGLDGRLRTRAAFLASVREDPRIKAASQTHYRVLPAEFVPALRGWAN